MTEREAADGPTTVRVSSPSHRVKVVAEDRADVVVEGKATSRESGSVMSVEGVRGSLVVRVPLGTDVQVGTESSRIEVEGAVGRLAATSSSGRVVVESAETADIRTSSGRIEVGAVTRDARLRTSSGRVVVGSCEQLDVSTDSGRIEVRDARGNVEASCVSGKVEVEMATAADVVAETVSGRIEVAMPQGTRVHRSTRNESSGDRPADCDCVVTARSVSGRVVVGER
jgi:DUF4097 and DUF4098 domain-containing protein YvlB